MKSSDIISVRERLRYSSFELLLHGAEAYSNDFCHLASICLNFVGNILSASLPGNEAHHQVIYKNPKDFHLLKCQKGQARFSCCFICRFPNLSQSEMINT